MAGSALSLDSLSSPSPSPTPPPVSKKQPSSKKNPATRPSLDSDSELSELTDDDQDPAASTDKRDRPPTSSISPAVASSKLISSSSGAAGALPPTPPTPASLDADDNAATGTVNRTSSSRRAGFHNRNPYTSRRGGAPRKKRSSLVPAPMWGWAESRATTSSAPVEEEEEEMAGPPRAMEEEEEEPDMLEEQEEEFDNYLTQDASAGAEEEEEEEGGFVTQRRFGPYVTQRLPGIRSIYSGRARHGKRQLLPSSRKYDADERETRTNGDEHKDASASGSEYHSPQKRKPAKSRPPTSAGSRKRKGSVPRESSVSDHPAPSRTKKSQQQDEEHVDTASDDATTRQKSDVENAKDIPLQIATSPSRFLPSSKPLSSIATSGINPADAALAALAVIADSVEKPTEASFELKSPLLKSTTMSPTRDLPPLSPNTPSAMEATPVESRSPSPDNSEMDEENIEPQPITYKVKRNTRRIPQRTKKGSDDWRPLGKPPGRPPNSKKPLPLDLRIDTEVDDAADEPAAEAVHEDTEEIEMDIDSNDADKNVDPEMEEEEADEENDGDGQDIEDGGEAEDEPAEVDGDEEEADVDTNEAENDQENENNNENENEVEEDETEEQPLPDEEIEDQEIELQPAHRAEALDVLASIELKFAMLRERVYVEKMEIFAWEESMIQASVHPEMQYLQKEMTKRRDKRLELASRKRSYEVMNATKRRTADEDGIWSWWKLSADDMQTEMIAETNRKRRKLERERRALERPQPFRRIPPPPTDLPLLPQHSLKKLLKSYSFGIPKSTSTKRRRHRQSHLQQPKNFVYPEISTLSVVDISHDLEYLYQNRRLPSSYDIPFGGPLTWGQTSPFSLRTGMGTAGGLGRPLSGMVGMGPGTTTLPPVAQNPPGGMGLPPPNSVPQHHPMPPYEQYPDASSYGGSRLRDGYPHGSGGPPPMPGSRDAYMGYPTRNQPSPSLVPSMIGSGYPIEHEMVSGGHQMMSNQPFFGQGGAGPPPAFTSTSMHGNNLKNVGNGRRSPSPLHMSNGIPNSSKSNAGWVSSGMGMGSFQIGTGKGGDRDRDIRTHEDDERDRIGPKERERRRGERDKDKDRRDYWEKEYPDHERDRTRDLYVHHPSQQYQHGSGAPLPGGPEGHHHPFHHHRNHHHHVLHRHGPPTSSLPSPVHPGSGDAPPIVHSPRSTRDYDMPGPPSGPNDGMMLSSNNNKPLPPPREREREREREVHWSQRNMDTAIHHSPVHDYRDRDKDLRKPYGHRPPSRPVPVDDRPTSGPFVMGPNMNGSGGIGSSTSSPKGQGLWSEEPCRVPPGGYMGGGGGGVSSHEPQRSPVQAHRYTPSGPPPSRGPPPPGHRIVSPPPLPPINRSRPPPSPYSHPQRSPPISPRLLPNSPSLPKPSILNSGRTVTPTGQRHTHASGSGHAPSLESHLKNGSMNNNYNRTESPHHHNTTPGSGSGPSGSGSLHGPSPSSRQGLNGNGNSAGDVSEQQRLPMSSLSPRLAPPVGSGRPS